MGCDVHVRASCTTVFASLNLPLYWKVEPSSTRINRCLWDTKTRKDAVARQGRNLGRSNETTPLYHTYPQSSLLEGGIVCDRFCDRFWLFCDYLWSFVIGCDHLWSVCAINWQSLLCHSPWMIDHFVGQNGWFILSAANNNNFGCWIPRQSNIADWFARSIMRRARRRARIIVG